MGKKMDLFGSVSPTSRMSKEELNKMIQGSKGHQSSVVPEQVVEINTESKTTFGGLTVDELNKVVKEFGDKYPDLSYVEEGLLGNIRRAALNIKELYISILDDHNTSWFEIIGYNRDMYTSWDTHLVNGVVVKEKGTNKMGAMTFASMGEALEKYNKEVAKVDVVDGDNVFDIYPVILQYLLFGKIVF